MKTRRDHTNLHNIFYSQKIISTFNFQAPKSGPHLTTAHFLKPLEIEIEMKNVIDG